MLEYIITRKLEDRPTEVLSPSEGWGNLVFFYTREEAEELYAQCCAIITQLPFSVKFGMHETDNGRVKGSRLIKMVEREHRS